MATKIARQTPGKRLGTMPDRATRPHGSAAKSAVGELDRATQRLDAIRLRSTATRLMASRRKDLGALVAANRKSLEGFQAVVKRHTELLKEQIGEWRSVARIVSVIGPRQCISELDELAKQGFLLSLANVKELVELSVKTQAEAFELVRGRFRQNIAGSSASLDGE